MQDEEPPASLDRAVGQGTPGASADTRPCPVPAPPFGGPTGALSHLDGVALLREALVYAFPGRIAVVSSFGAEAAVLLALAAEIDPSVPVLFLETGQHFPETLEYRRTLVARLGLRRVLDVTPEPRAVAAADPENRLHAFDPDACCGLRKVAPLERALERVDVWVTGRKRYQGGGRAGLPLIELVGGRLKINPLVNWPAERIEAEFLRRDLPRHPLIAQGYRSIGCAPCTRPVAPGEHGRAGRWAGRTKTECGIHRG